MLVVPEVVLGRRDGQAWLTTIGDPAAAGLATAGLAPGRALRARRRLGHGFRPAVAEAVRRIAAGELEKVVLAHDLLALADGPIDVALRARRARRPLSRTAGRSRSTGSSARHPSCWCRLH